MSGYQKLPLPFVGFLGLPLSTTRPRALQEENRSLSELKGNQCRGRVRAPMQVQGCQVCAPAFRCLRLPNGLFDLVGKCASMDPQPKPGKEKPLLHNHLRPAGKSLRPQGPGKKR